MKKTTVINNNTQTFTEVINEVKMMNIILVSPEFSNGDWFTLRELVAKVPVYKYGYASNFMRSQNRKFPHPVAVRTSVQGGMSYLYSLKEYNAFCFGNNGGGKDQRALDRARKMEAQAARIRYRLKRKGFTVSVKETTNKGDK